MWCSKYDIEYRDKLLVTARMRGSSSFPTQSLHSSVGWSLRSWSHQTELVSTATAWSTWRVQHHQHYHHSTPLHSSTLDHVRLTALPTGCSSSLNCWITAPTTLVIEWAYLRYTTSKEEMLVTCDDVIYFYYNWSILILQQWNSLLTKAGNIIRIS